MFEFPDIKPLSQLINALWERSGDKIGDATRVDIGAKKVIKLGTRS